MGQDQLNGSSNSDDVDHRAFEPLHLLFRRLDSLSDVHVFPTTLAKLCSRCNLNHTNSPLSKSDILSVADRVALSSVRMPDWHRTELDSRIAAHQRNSEAARPWDEVEAELLAELRK